MPHLTTNLNSSFMIACQWLMLVCLIIFPTGHSCQSGAINPYHYGSCFTLSLDLHQSYDYSHTLQSPPEGLPGHFHCSRPNLWNCFKGVLLKDCAIFLCLNRPAVHLRQNIPLDARLPLQVANRYLKESRSHLDLFPFITPHLTPSDVEGSKRAAFCHESLTHRSAQRFLRPLLDLNPHHHPDLSQESRFS